MQEKRVDNTTEHGRMPVTTALFIYWIALVAWQNIMHLTSGSSFDLVFKLILLVFLFFYFLMQSRMIDVKNFLRFLLIFALFAATFAGDNKHDLRTMIFYLFPLLLAFLSLCLNNRMKVSLDQYIRFLEWFIFAVLYMAVYSIIFETSHFTNLSSLTTAYSNELSAFFASNLEYGMYLCFGILSIIIVLNIKKEISQFQKAFYYFLIPIFAVNLVLTYSRTSIIACVAAVIAYAIFCKKKKLIIAIVCIIIIGLTLFFAVPSINSYVSNIVFKQGALSGRDKLSDVAGFLFRNSNYYQKLFGLGYGRGASIIVRYSSHGSLHNAFLQVLITNGIFGVIVLVVVLITNVILNIRFIKFDRFWGAIFLALSIFPIIYMLTTTSVVFYSSIDSSLLTFFTILIPHYCKNAVLEEYLSNLHELPRERRNQCTG